MTELVAIYYFRNGEVQPVLSIDAARSKHPDFIIQEFHGSYPYKGINDTYLNKKYYFEIEDCLPEKRNNWAIQELNTLIDRNGDDEGWYPARIVQLSIIDPLSKLKSMVFGKKILGVSDALKFFLEACKYQCWESLELSEQNKILTKENIELKKLLDECIKSKPG